MKKSATKAQGSQRGFTLIELLTVIAIITVLTSLLLPAIAAAKVKAMSVQCQGRLRQVCLASEMYRIDFDRFMSALEWESQLESYAPSQEIRYVPELDVTFYKIFECTGPLRSLNGLTWSKESVVDGKIENNMVEFENIRWPVRLGFNKSGLGKSLLVLDANGETSRIRTGLANQNPSRVTAPSNCIQFGDSPSGRIGIITNQGLSSKSSGYDNRHGAQSNMAFVDGHVESANRFSWQQPTAETRRRFSIDNQPHLQLLEKSR